MRLAINLVKIRWAIFAFSTLSGIALAMFIGDRDNGPDAATYLRNSEDFRSFSALIDEQSFGRNFWPAGYSGFLRIFAGLGDYWLPGVRVTQVLMAASMAFMAYHLTKHLSEKVATLTFIVVALSPSSVWFALVINYEVLLGWLLTLSVTLLWRVEKARNPRVIASIAGLSFGLALIVQFKSVVVLPVLIYLALRSHSNTTRYVTLGFFIPLGTWMLRNFVALGNPAPWSANGPVNIWFGNRPDGTGGYPVYESVQVPPANQYVSEALKFASEAVRPFLELQARKGLRFWYPNVPIDFHLELPHVIDWLLVFFFFVYAFMALALFLLFIASVLWRLQSGLTSLAPLAVVVVLMFFVNMPFIVDPRFRIPVEALLLTICVPTLARLTKRWTIPASNADA